MKSLILRNEFYCKRVFSGLGIFLFYVVRGVGIRNSVICPENFSKRSCSDVFYTLLVPLDSWYLMPGYCYDLIGPKTTWPIGLIDLPYIRLPGFTPLF